MSPYDYCREKAARPGSTVYYSALFVREETRRGIVAASAFCREISEVTVESKDITIARTKLAWWRTEIATIYQGKPRHPVAVALAEFSSERGVEQATLDALISGSEMNLDYNAYPDFEALKVYCRRVGGALATAWAQICGYQEPRSGEVAGDLGIAWQLTKIIRDIGADARRDRIYVPLHELSEYGVTSDDLANARQTDNFRKLIAFQVERAEACYADALAKLPAIDRKALRPVLVASAINRALLREIRSDSYNVLAGRTSLTPLRKLWLAWRTPL